VAFEARPPALGVELVPPFILSVPLVLPAVTRLARMPSTDACESAQFWKALVKLVAGHESNMLVGKLVREEQPYQALLKFVPFAVLIKGKLVREEQFCQA
jgi:hypothetical protein